MFLHQILRNKLFPNISGKASNVNACMKSLCEIMIEVSYVH